MAIKLIEFPHVTANVPLRIAQGHFATSHSHLNYYIDMTMRAEDRRKAVANGLRKAMKTGDEIRFNRECSMWESGDNLVLCAYGYKPQTVNIEGTFTSNLHLTSPPSPPETSHADN